MKKILFLMFTLLIGTAARADDGGKAFLEPMKYLHDAYPYEDEAGDFNGDTYEYSIVFGLVRVGDTWKIDTMKPGKGDVVISDPGIQNGSRWNLGNLDYSAKVNEDRTITFNSMAEGEELVFRLTPNYSKKDEYTLSDEPGANGFNSFSSSPRVKLIDKYGMKLLCLYDTKGMLQHVLDGKARLEGEKEALSILFNGTVNGTISKRTWYQPGVSNDEVEKPFDIEMLNLELIKAEEAKSDDERYVKE